MSKHPQIVLDAWHRSEPVEKNFLSEEDFLAALTDWENSLEDLSYEWADQERDRRIDDE